MKKLLLTIPALQAGGAERVMTLLANHWAGKGWDITLVTYEHPDAEPFYPLDSCIKRVSLDTLSLGERRLQLLLNRFFYLRKELRCVKPDLVLSFLDTCNTLTLIASVGLKIPTIVSERTNPKTAPISWMKKILRDFTYGWAERVVIQTERTREFFPARLRKLLRVIPNPVVTNATKCLKQGSKIIAVGRLSKEKAFDTLIHAFSLIASTHKEWSLVIRGEGPERGNLGKLIKEKSLEGRVLLPGRTKKIHEEMAKGSLFVLSSRFEGMPNALCEAMSLGLPVISTDCPTGPREVITHGEDGMLVPVDDVQEMARAMEDLIKDVRLREKLGEKASQKMKQYDMETISALWEKVFDEVV